MVDGLSFLKLEESTQIISVNLLAVNFTYL